MTETHPDTFAPGTIRFVTDCPCPIFDGVRDNRPGCPYHGDRPGPDRVWPSPVPGVDTTATELRAALEDVKHFLYQIRNQTLGSHFLTANYKHRVDELYEKLGRLLGEPDA
jgi:hypothetical protein